MGANPCSQAQKSGGKRGVEAVTAASLGMSYSTITHGYNVHVFPYFWPCMTWHIFHIVIYILIYYYSNQDKDSNDIDFLHLLTFVISFAIISQYTVASGSFFFRNTAAPDKVGKNEFQQTWKRKT